MNLNQTEVISTPYGAIEKRSQLAGLMVEHPITGEPVNPVMTLWMHVPTEYIVCLRMQLPDAPDELPVISPADVVHPVGRWLIKHGYARAVTANG